MVAAKGQVNLVVPGEAHDGHGADSEGWAYRMFYLKPEALMEAAGALVARPDFPHFRMGVIDDPALAGCVASTHRLPGKPGRFAHRKGNAAVAAARPLDIPVRGPARRLARRRC